MSAEGEALLDLAERTLGPVQGDGGFSETDTSMGLVLARAYQQNGDLTDYQRQVARAILDRHGITVTNAVGAVTPPAPRRPALDTSKKASGDVSFRVEGERILARTPFALKELCKAIPGRRWDGDSKCWWWPAGPVAAATLVDVFGEYNPTWDPAFDRLANQVADAQAHKVADDDDLPDIPGISTTPWLHQRRAWAYMMALGPACALWMEQGCGKSLPAVARSIQVGGDTLIVCPSKVLGVWPREFRRHGDTPVHIENGLRPMKRKPTVMKPLSLDDRLDAFGVLAACDCGRPHVYVVNYQAVWQKGLGAWILGHPWDLVIMDESQSIKSSTAVSSKHMAKVCARATNRLQLSGTPMPHSPLDVFAQFKALDPTVFGAAFTSFKKRYAMWGGYEDHQYLGMDPEHEDEFWRKAYSIAFRVLATDVLDVPEVMPDTFIEVTLTGNQAKTYADMEADAFAEFPGLSRSQIVQGLVYGTLSSPNAMVKNLRLCQITGGSLKDENTEQVLEVGSAKADALAEWMEDFPDGQGVGFDGQPQPAEPLVVFCRFRHDLDVVQRIAEAQGRRYGEISGRRNDLTADAEYPDDVDVMGVQIRSGGAGIDLTRACHALYYSVGYSLGDYQQSLFRLHRPGQTRPVRFYYMTAIGTVDGDIWDALGARAEDIAPLNERR